MEKHKVTIKNLRQNGFKVRVIHTTTDLIPDVYKEKIDPRAIELSKIVTCVQVKDPTGAEHRGVALCSKLDNWDRKLGNKIALARAIKTVPQDYINEIK